MKRMYPILVVVWLVVGPTAQAHEGHAHTSEQGQALIDPSLLGFTGLHEVFNVHPAFVHFPVALFPSALLLYGLGIVLKRRSWIVAGRACLYLAAASTAATFITGWQAQSSFPHNARIHHMMMTHLHLGLAISILAIVLVIWSFLQKDQRPKAAYPFLGALTLMAYLVLQNGDLGSRMVYVEGAAVKPAVAVITESQDESRPAHHHDDDASPHHHTQ